MNRDRSIEMLNEAVADELQAVHQYMYFHFHLDDQGFGPLATLFKQTAITEMTHAEDLAERILFLGGDVDMVPAASVERIQDPEAMLKWAADSEAQAVVDYNKAANECTQLSDAGSRHVFEGLINDEEMHFDAFDGQLDNLKRFGPNYLALQSFEGGGMGEGHASA